MSEEFGPDFITVTDEDGNEFELEMVETPHQKTAFTNTDVTSKTSRFRLIPRLLKRFDNSRHIFPLHTPHSPRPTFHAPDTKPRFIIFFPTLFYGIKQILFLFFRRFVP